MKKIFVFMGPGGVGKTTMAAAVGLLAARGGKKVLVLTIDPSKRLAQTLGIEDCSEPTQVQTLSGGGELWASIIDHQKTFDEFVEKAAQHSPGVERLLKNHLYRQMTTTLSGSQDFSSLEKLYAMYSEGDFDVIVLDTPPAQHALTFLEAPEKIASLFNDRIAKWFRDSGPSEKGFFKKIIGLGAQQVLKVLESLTGSEFIRELREFFNSIEGWQSKLQERTSAVHKLLVSQESHFFLVTGIDKNQLRETDFFAKEIRRKGYQLDGVILNRAFPLWYLKEPNRSPVKAQEVLYQEFLHLFEGRKRRIQEFVQNLQSNVVVTQLPELTDKVHDLKGLEKVALTLAESGWKK